MRVLEWLHRRNSDPQDMSESACPEELIAEAERRRREAYARWPAVNAAAAAVDAQGKRNHFGETVDASYQNRRRHA